MCYRHLPICMYIPSRSISADSHCILPLSLSHCFFFVLFDSSEERTNKRKGPLTHTLTHPSVIPNRFTWQIPKTIFFCTMTHSNSFLPDKKKKHRFFSSYTIHFVYIYRITGPNSSSNSKSFFPLFPFITFLCASKSLECQIVPHEKSLQRELRLVVIHAVEAEVKHTTLRRRRTTLLRPRRLSLAKRWMNIKMERRQDTSLFSMNMKIEMEKRSPCVEIDPEAMRMGERRGNTSMQENLVKNSSNIMSTKQRSRRRKRRKTKIERKGRASKSEQIEENICHTIVYFFVSFN